MAGTSGNQVKATSDFVWSLPGYGPQKLCTLAAYAMRMALLQWLEQYKVDREQEAAKLRRKVCGQISSAIMAAWLTALR